ncbi:hypothetical protein H8356DRAFT_1327299 [Neocallimastix lanati (nom. inval.)]|nr:hypothetical protein H8356DRAFT_1327299 [Neocallimastix sp. JGI-2020a]
MNIGLLVSHFLYATLYHGLFINDLLNHHQRRNNYTNSLKYQEYLPWQANIQLYLLGKNPEREKCLINSGVSHKVEPESLILIKCTKLLI